MPGRAHDAHGIGERQDPRLRARLEPGPLLYVLFRPKEVHAASGKGQVGEPLLDRLPNRSLSPYLRNERPDHRLLP